MKRLFPLTCIIFLLSFKAFGQDSLKVKTNPIIYGDLGLSAPITGIGGIEFNSSLNYQYRHSLFTLRVATIKSFTIGTIDLSPFTVFPYFKDAGHLNEWSFLYGWRIVRGGHSFSFSAGISDNDRVITYYTGNVQHQIEYKYAGLPFEVNVLWFKPRKEKYHVYYLIPVGKPTGFGHSIGFKFSGNLSQHSYASLGIVFGLGYHKSY